MIFPKDPQTENSFKLLPNAAAYEPLLFQLVGSARGRVSVVMYIFRPDEVGRRFLSALVDTARRGVAVTVVVDALGSLSTPKGFFEPLIRAGGRVTRFNPQFGRASLVRMHQKLVAADDQQGVIGGFNIGDEYFDPVSTDDFRELALGVGCRETAALHDYVDCLYAWCVSARRSLPELREILLERSDQKGSVQWLHGGAGNENSPLLSSLRDDLAKASRLDAISGYFAPPAEFLRDIELVANRGRVRLIVPGKSDVPLARAAARSFYVRLQRAGCEVYEYPIRPLHAKLLVLDDVVYVGSTNLDPRSLYTNIELALRVECPSLAKQARELIDAEVNASRAITQEWLQKKASWANSLGWRTAHFLLYRLDQLLCRTLMS